MKTNILISTWIGFDKVISRIYSRLDSLSIVSRQSVLAIVVACLTVFGVGDVWGATDTKTYDGSDLSDWSGTHSGQYADESLKLDATGETAYKYDIWSGVVSTGMTSITVTINYKINGSGNSSNVFTVAAVNSSGTVKASQTFAPTSTSYTDAEVTLTIPASSAVTGLQITYTTKTSGNVGISSLEAIATYTSTYTATIARNNTSYGTVSTSSVGSLSSGAAITKGTGANINKITIGGTTVTATPAAQDADYDYAFSSWTVPGNVTTVTADITITANFTRTARPLTNYRTICCTPLGTISGSVSLGQLASPDPTKLKATWTMTAETGIDSYDLEVYNNSDVLVKTINDYSSGDEITGLSPCTTYYVKLYTVSDGSPYCDGGLISTSSTCTTNSWTVDKSGVTNVTAASLSAIPATTCASGFGPITIAAADGYALPSSVSVTGASSNWNQATGALTISSVTGNVTITITPTCVSPVVVTPPADANYYVGDSPTALSVTATLGSGTLTYLWKVSTNGGSTWSDAAGTNDAASYSGSSLSTASAGMLKFKCIVGNSDGGCEVESGVATITVANASYFTNGATVFIQAESSSAWDASACVKAWFNASGAGGAAQATYWLFNATGVDDGKKIYAAVVPADGDLNQVTLQRFASNCSDFYNANGTLTQASSGGSNIFCSNGSGNSNVSWKATALTMNLMSSVNWNSSVASVTDQGSGVWKGTYEYTPAATSTDYVIATNYNGNLGNTGVNPNATLSGMIVGSTYNVTATFNIMAHTLVMSKEFVKGEVSFDLQGHGDAISKLTNVTAGSKISAPSEPSATGYTFGGWFTDPECTDEWTFATDEVSETMTLYAKWTANVYTITKMFSNVANASIPDNFTYTGSTTTALNSTFTVNTTNFFLPSSITVTMGGTPLTAGSDYTYNNSTGAFTFDVVITGDIVITASATAKLKSIAITTQPTTRKYLVGETFSSTGAVVTATMGDGSTKAVTASTTWTPTTALSAGSQTITASYTEGGINQTTTTTVDVYSVTVNKVNMSGDEIEDAGVSASNSVRTLSQSVGSTNYLFNLWEVTAGGVTISTNTITGTPSANVVINAKFHDPITITWKVGNNAAGGSPTTEVKYGSAITALPSTPADDAISCFDANKFMGWTAGSKIEETGHSAPGDLFTTVGGAAALTANTTYRAVFAKHTEGEEEEDQDPYTHTITSQTWSAEGAQTLNGKSWTLANNGGYYGYTADKGQQVGSGGNPASTMSLSTSGISGKIKAVKITTSGAASVVATVGVSVGTTDFTSGGNTTVSISATSTEYTFTGSATGTITISWANSSAKALYFKKIEVDYATVTPTVSNTNYITGCCSDPGLAYTPATETKTFGDAAFIKTLTNSNNVAVTYALSNVSPAGCVTINSTTGQVSIVGAGSATVTASSIAQEVNDISYCADEASYTLTVNKANITPTLSYESGTLVIGDDSSDPTISGNTGEGGVTYAVTTANPAGCVTVNANTGVVTAVAEGTATITATVAETANYNSATATANFTVTCDAPSEVEIEGAYQFYPGETIELTATPTGGAGTPVTYQWKKNGVNIVGATSATYTKNNATAADAGAYTCTVQYGSNCATTSSAFQLKCMQFYLKTSLGEDIDHYALTKVDATHATLSLNLTGGTTYNFRITDGCNDWYGNSDETGITSANCNNWTMPHDADAKVTTGTKTATYTFNFDFTAGVLGDQMKVSVVYPSTNQASGKVIYWDNEVNDWDGSKLWYRIGKSNHNANTQLSKVAGTANFYSVTTSTYDGFDYWHIANNEGQGTGNIYWTKDNSGSGLEITHAMGFEGAPVTEAATTVTPTTTHTTGTTSDNDNCEFYTYSITTGMKTYTVASSGTNCTVTMEKYNDDAGTSTTALASGGTVMPTQYIKVTVTPTTGYQFSSVVVTNGTTVTAAAAGTPGVYYITGNATVTATCTVKSCTVNFNKNSGTGGDGSTTATYGSAMTTVTTPTRTGYTFDGYWDGAGGTGTQYYLANGTSARNWDKDVTADQTLYAKWNAKQYTIELDREGAASGATSVTATFDAGTMAGWSAPTKTGYEFGGYWSADNGTGTMVINASGVLQSSVQISSVNWTDGSGHWVKDGGVTVYAKWTAEQYTITYKDQGDAAYSGSNLASLPAKHTYGAATDLVDGVRSGYRFDGWFDNSGCTGDAVTTIGATAKTAAFTLYAKWTQVYTVTWHVGNGTWDVGQHNVTVGNTNVVSGSKIDAMPDAPADNTLSACASKFMGWSTHSWGATPKGTGTGEYDDLFTTVGGSPTISANTDIYAVFAEVTEDKYWSMGTIDKLGSGTGYAAYDGTHTVTGSDGNSYTYESSYVMSNSGNQFKASSDCGRIYNTSSLGNINRIVLNYSAYKGQMKVYESDSQISSSGTTALTETVSGEDNEIYTYECSGKGYFIVIQEGSNAAKADVTVYFGSSASNYRTQCDANLVKVTYDANGGSSTCAGGSHDKRNDYTVCATEPTKDYYEFAGWLCSADSKTYAASATIDDAAIDDDFTLTAQWTPVSYSITYNYNGGSAQVDPTPATSYTVESSDITLQTPTYGHNRFEGWYENADLSTGGVKTTIAAGSHENKTYYAKWATRHHIEFFKEGTSIGEMWRADDENLEDAVAGQGSVPSDPSAPTTCSSKVFVGWSESEIDDETDDEPADLMKPAAGTVDEDKEYYAVWATSSSGSVTKTYDWEKATIPGWTITNFVERTSSQGIDGSYAGKVGSATYTDFYVKYNTKVNATSFTFNLKRTSNNSNYYCYIETSTNGTDWDWSTTGASYDMGDFGNGSYTSKEKTWDGETAYYVRLHVYTSNTTRYVDNVSITYNGDNYTAYSTSCCATKVTLSQNSPENGTIAFGKTSVGTCGGDKDVTLTITPAAGYQLHSYEVATGDGKVATKTDPGISLDNNSSAAQDITLTFASGASGAYDVTASFSEMIVTSWSWTNHDGGAAVTNTPFEIYVGQSARVDVAYNPSSVLSSHKNYSRSKDDTYINWPGGAQPSAYCTFIGKATTGENTTTITLTHSDAALEQLVYVKVLPLPLVHFEDLVHGKAFADVAATIVDNALSATKTTPTSDDWTTPNANDCEGDHLHLVGWIREDWPALVAYLNGTGDAPTTVAITGAGNDGEGHAYFFAPNASINVQTFDGVTFYAVWAKIE